MRARNVHMKSLSSKFGVELRDEDVKKQSGCEFVDDVGLSRVPHP